ncbi:MAG: hypothetical protein Q9178_008001 [Gyalolechia marmorata]
MNQAADRHEQANRAGNVLNANANTFSADSLSSGSELGPDDEGSEVSDDLVIQNENEEDRRYREYQQEDYLYRVKVLIKEPFRAGHRIRFNSAIKSALSGAMEFLQGKFDTDEIDKPIKDAMDSQGLPDIDYIIFHAQPQQPSSPIADDEEEILQDFFVWKMELYNDPAKRRRIADTKAIVSEEMWTLDHLKKMSDPTKAYYTQGRTAGIPHGILLAFNDDIHKFKQYYRTTLAPARALGHLGGGGFIS